MVWYLNYVISFSVTIIIIIIIIIDISRVVVVVVVVAAAVIMSCRLVADSLWPVPPNSLSIRILTELYMFSCS